MSLGVSLSAALSGLTANARAASTVSANIANANTPGYGVRSLELASSTIGSAGAGVRVVSTLRAENLALLQDRRFAEADAGAATELATFARQMEKAIGLPGEPGSIATMVTGFEQALVEASASPESTVRLGAVVGTAHSLVDKINTVSDEISVARQAADQEIGRTVTAINVALEQIVELNAKIMRGGSASRDVSSLIDARQKLVDDVAGEIPLRQIDRGRGEIALMGLGGVMLIDGSAAELSFAPRASVNPAMSVQNGALSTLEINGNALDIHGTFRPLRGGRLEALFTVRDIDAPKAQARVDAYARDQIERFQDPGVDPTLAVGAAGLFTDAGAAFDPLNEVGVSQRIALNIAVDPGQGGDLWRLRDGIDALAPGPLGDSQQIERFVTAMSGTRLAGSGDFVSVARSAAGLSADLLSIFSAERNAAENREAFAATQAAALRTEELERGVDTDAEMQKLLIVEQAYAANAKVIETVSEMLELLQRIT